MLLIASVFATGCERDAPEPAASPAQLPPSKPPHVVWVVLDTLAVGHTGLSSTGLDTTPHLDALARESRHYERAYAQWPSTMPSTSSYLTGRYPPTNWSRVSYPTIAEVLGEEGYLTIGISENPNVSSTFGLDRGFAQFRLVSPAGPAMEALQNYEPKSGASVAWVIEQLDAAPGDTRVFAYLHLLPPHSPYQPPDPFRGQRLPEAQRTLTGSVKELGAFAFGAPPSDAELGQIVEMYRENVSYADHQVGRVVEALRARGRLDDTLLIVTSDHGEAFYEHGRLGHASSIYAEQVRVPLLIRFPPALQVAPGVDGSPVELVDIAPTVFDAIGIEGPPELDGASLLDATRARHFARAWFRSDVFDTEQASVADGRYRLVRIDGRDELYDLTSDAEERRDIATAFPEIVARLAPRLVRDEAEASPVEIDAETIRQLRALGYDPTSE